MHGSLTEHARCLYGDEYTPTPPCDREHREHYFIEELTFADANAILAMLDALCPNIVDGHLPVWARNLAYRLVLLQRPDDPALLRRAADNLRLHGPDWDDIATTLTRRAESLAPLTPPQAPSPANSRATSRPAVHQRAENPIERPPRATRR